MARKGRLYIGCSGWDYQEWQGLLYPQGLPRAERLSAYTARFDSGEVNNSFCRLPEQKTFAAWRERVPPNFLFALKASRFITHVKRLSQPEQSLQLFWERAWALDAKFGPVLYQLPPRWHVNLPRLRNFLTALPEHPQAIEFRHRSWYCDDVYTLLDTHRVTMCLHDMHDSASPYRCVGPFMYLRFHGTAEKYTGSYSEQAITL